MNRHRQLMSAPRGLFVGLDVLLLALVVLALAQADPAHRVAGFVAGVALLGAYAWGRVVVRVHERSVDTPRGAWWPDTAWVVALMVPWAVLLWASPGALWIAFPLMLVQMHVLGPHRGTIAVAVSTVLAVTEGLLVRAAPDDPWTGFVLGPVIGACVAVGVVLGLEALVRESQSRQRTVDELTHARQHLAVAERERAVAAERERLAREIHDTLAQSLSAIELLLRTADRAVDDDAATAHALVAQARDAARTSLAEARRFVRDLTPTDLEGTTLVAALHRVAERTAASHPGAAARDAGGALDVSVAVHGAPRSLPVPTEAALLRIAQSALANVTQHSGAARAQVTLTYDDAAVILDVVDDGRGFDPEAAHPADLAAERGFGLPAIRSRATELGGTFAVETAPGRGTAVAVTLPTDGGTP